MRYTQLSGQELLSRRMSGKCLECGTNTPMVDDSGFGKDLCYDCSRQEKKEQAQRRKKEREAAVRA